MRLRITFGKTEEMRYSGHLDLHRTWERTFRRAKLPIAYSQGFHPQPRINLAAALPLGFTSESELADVWLEAPLPLPVVTEALERALPPGIQVLHVEEVDLRAPTLQNQVVSSEYQVTLLDPCHDLSARLKGLLDAESLPRERRGKTYDLRPLVEHLEQIEADENGRARILVRLAARSGATGRPEELLSALDIQPEAARVHRTRLIFTGDSSS